MQLWGIVRRNHKIAAQTVAPADLYGEWTLDALQEGVGEVCQLLDLSRPILMEKHRAEMEKFGRTVFKQADFVEPISFDALEIEQLDDKRMKPEDKKRR